MKILKMCVLRQYGNSAYYCLFDEIPQITYERVGLDYVGSATDEHGNIIFSEFLKKEMFKGAFAGRELKLTMKDGSHTVIKDYWYDRGSYPEHGEFCEIGGGTLEQLQKCYVYSGYCINAETFQMMLDDYYSRECEYGYDEIKKWCELQYKWYDVKINGVLYPVMVNKYGNFVDKFTKKPIYPRINKHNIRKCSEGIKEYPICLFKYQFTNCNRLVKIEKKMLDVLRESLIDFTDEEIIKNCKLEEYTKKGV